jgi:transcriptional regulator with XRE-family HTH domain
MALARTLAKELTHGLARLAVQQESVAEVVRQIINELCETMTLKSLAERTGYTNVWLSNIRHGKANADVALARKLIEVAEGTKRG